MYTCCVFVVDCLFVVNVWAWGMRVVCKGVWGVVGVLGGCVLGWVLVAFWWLFFLPKSHTNQWPTFTNTCSGPDEKKKKKKKKKNIATKFGPPSWLKKPSFCHKKYWLTHRNSYKFNFPWIFYGTSYESQPL